MRLLYCRWRPTPIRMISYTFTMHYGLHSAPFIWRAFCLPELEGSKPLFNRGSGRLEDWTKCFCKFVHFVLMFPTLIPNTCSHYRSMPIIHFLHLLSQLAHIHIAAPEISSMTAIIISAYLTNEGMPTVLPQGHHI